MRERGMEMEAASKIAQNYKRIEFERDTLKNDDASIDSIRYRLH